MKKILFTAAAIGLMCSCSLYRTFETPEIKKENICGDYETTQDSLAKLPSWKEIFADKPLQSLLEKGLASNVDLQIARLNIEQAEALLLSSKLAYLPAFALAPEGSVSKTPGVPAVQAYNLPLTTQWELDVFGKLRNTKEQARASVMQSGEYAKMVQTQLVASIANSYYTLVMLDQQLQITQQFVINQKENLEVITAMKEAGMQTETAVNQATAAYYDVQSSAKNIERQIREVENGIAILMNQTPHTIVREEMIHSVGPRINYQAAIPLAVLTHRPDVREAEYALSRNFYGVNVARAAFYPAISLAGSVGWTNNLGVISNPGSLLLSAIGSLTQPLFNRGVNRANLKIAKLQYEQSLLTFEKTLLLAGNEVNNALVACQNSAAKEDLRQKQVEANTKAWENNIELMKHSSITYLEILITQSALLQSRLVQVQDWFEGVQGQIGLYKALGGGVE